MKISGERIIVFGDSLSHHGSDSAPEIWDVDQGSNRSTSQPGDFLASMLVEQGAAAARVNARVGRSAVNFWGRENTQGLIASDKTFRPTKVVVILGTNDLHVDRTKTAAAMTAIRDTYRNMGAEVWAIGPMTYAEPSLSLNTESQAVVDTMKAVFAGRFIDGRPLSINTGRARDGVHFGPTSARQTAANMLQALADKKAAAAWIPVAAGLAIAIGGAVLYSRWKQRHPSGLLGLTHPSDAEWSMAADAIREGRLKEAAQIWVNIRQDYGFVTPSKSFDAAWRELPFKDHLKFDDYINKAKGLSGNEDMPGFRFMDLLRDPDPASMDIAEDLILENQLKLSDISGGRGAPNGTFALVSAGAPRDKWKMVQWRVRKAQAANTHDIEIHIANGSARVVRKYSVFGSFDYARRNAAADAWAIAKGLKRIPMDTSEQKLEKIIDQDLTPGVIGNDGLENKPELYGVPHAGLTPSQARHLEQVTQAGEFVETYKFSKKGRGSWSRTMKGINTGVLDQLAKMGLLVRTQEVGQHGTVTRWVPATGALEGIKGLDAMKIVQTINDASTHQIKSSREGKAITAAGLGQELAIVIDKTARNAAGPIVADIEDANEET